MAIVRQASCSPLPPKRPAPVGSVNDDPLMRAGRIAWKRVREAAAQPFDSWICIGRALCACRRIAMKTSKTTKPFGGAFNRAMGALLKEHGFDAIDPATRSEAAWLVANLQEVIEWRDSLPEYRRIALNSPGHVKREFLASQKGSVRPPGPRRLRRSIDMLAEGGEAMPGQDAATIEQASSGRLASARAENSAQYCPDRTSTTCRVPPRRSLAPHGRYEPRPLPSLHVGIQPVR